MPRAIASHRRSPSGGEGDIATTFLSSRSRFLPANAMVQPECLRTNSKAESLKSFSLSLHPTQTYSTGSAQEMRVQPLVEIWSLLPRNSPRACLLFPQATFGTYSLLSSNG